jgi:hypothetical protein
MTKYKTSDLYFSAYLKTAGVRFLGTETDGSKVFFLFEKTDMIRDLKRDFFNRTAKVPALTFVDEIRNMKSMTFMARTGS